jgi:hypothetical protein
MTIAAVAFLNSIGIIPSQNANRQGENDERDYDRSHRGFWCIDFK